MRIPKINANSFKSINTESITEVIDPDVLERVVYDPDIDPEDSKTFPKVINTIKSMCRTSNEYKALMIFLKEHRDFNQSFLYTGIKKTYEKKFTIEIHHTPFVLEDIVATVINKRMANGESMAFVDICNEIMWLHYSGLVGLIPLDKTHHALIHSENAPEVFIPLQYIDFGDFHEFYVQYKPFIPDNVKDTYSYLQDLSMKYERLKDVVPNYMNPKHLYYSGFVKIEAFEELLDELKG